VAEPSTIARPYAEAAFQLAADKGALPEWSDMLGALDSVIGHPRVRQVIGDPNVPAARAAGVIIGVLAGSLTGEAENFVRVLAENRRLALVGAIRGEFERLKDESDRSVEAVVDTAFPLDDAQLAAIVAQVERKIGRKVKTRMVVDPELIGGVKITIGDKVFDASARAQLVALGTALRI
jgi:F-type H+-transporting ATPase subunit delta